MHPPRRPRFGHWFGNATSYTPPDLAGTGSVVTHVIYNGDDAVSMVKRPDSTTIANSHDVAGRHTLVSHGSGSTSFPYSPASKLLMGVEASTGENLAFTYTSGLLTSTKATGSAPDTVTSSLHPLGRART